MHSTLLPETHAGKRPGQCIGAALSTGLPRPSRLVYVKDNRTGTLYLVDTGADVSVIPATATNIRLESEPQAIQAANGTPIATFGMRKLTIDPGLTRTFDWEFIIANVPMLILGKEFPGSFNLLVENIPFHY